MEFSTSLLRQPNSLPSTVDKQLSNVGRRPMWLANGAMRLRPMSACAFVSLLLGLLWLSLLASGEASAGGLSAPQTGGDRLNLLWRADPYGNDDDNPAGSHEIEMTAVVLSIPGHELGYGDWTMRSFSGRVYRVVVTSVTEIKSPLPTLGQTAKIKGFYRFSTQGDEIVATRIEVEDPRDDEKRSNELQGILVTAPENGIGLWVLQTGFTLTVEINADATTRLDDGVPSPGQWLDVRGNWQTDGTFVASRIRIEDHRVNEVVVRLAQDVISATLAARYSLVPKETLLRSGNVHLFLTREDEERNIVTQLTTDPDVLWAELNYVGGIPEGHGYKTWRWGGTTPDGYVNQGAFDQVNLTAALGSYQGNGVVIAILDTGINQSHSAFQGRLLAGYDMVDDDADPEDEGDGVGWGHGTHIAGIVARMSPQSKLLPVRVLNSNGRGNTFALAYAIEWAVEHGADVINLSLGADANSKVLNDVIEQAVAKGVIIVAAAGNGNTSQPQFPARLPGVISVTAVDSANIKADFASYGADWVDLAAPGVGITSTVVGPLGSGYASWSGTSMSTGFVSGAAALIREQLPLASVRDIQQLFTGNTRDLDQYNPAYAGQLGGLLDVAAALDVEEPSSTPTPIVTPAPTPTPSDPGSGGDRQLYIPLVQR